MEKFRIVKKGYDKAEVDAFVKTQQDRFENTMQQQTMRIEELKAQVSDLEEAVSEYKSKEKNVNEALLTAIERAKEMDSTTKIRFALEGERIKLFEAKWTAYCRKTMQSHKIKNDLEEFLESVDREIAKITDEQLNIGTEKELPPEKPAKRRTAQPKQTADKDTARSNLIEKSLNDELDEPLDIPLNNAEKQYESEKKRLEAKNKDIAADTFADPSNPDRFNLDDINDPPTLADICRQLGLYFD